VQGRGAAPGKAANTDPRRFSVPEGVRLGRDRIGGSAVRPGGGGIVASQGGGRVAVAARSCVRFAPGPTNRPSNEKVNAMKPFVLSLCLLLMAILSGQGGAAPAEVEPAEFDLTETIQVFRVNDDVSFDDAIDSMKLRANTLNFKLVAHMPLSEQIEAMGETSRRMEIFQFCDALIAKRMVEFNLVFAGYLPCRIAVIEGEDGSTNLVTMNMDLMLKAADLPPALAEDAQQVRDTIYSIVDAGVNGDL
jgi:uncharacterized protein (DUF302 family)